MFGAGVVGWVAGCEGLVDAGRATSSTLTRCRPAAAALLTAWDRVRPMSEGMARLLAGSTLG